MPDSSTGGRSGNRAISERLPPIASTVRRNVDSNTSLRCSSRETSPLSYRSNSNFEYVLESVFFFDFTRATIFGVRMSLTARPIR